MPSCPGGRRRGGEWWQQWRGVRRQRGGQLGLKDWDRSKRSFSHTSPPCPPSWSQQTHIQPQHQSLAGRCFRASVSLVVDWQQSAGKAQPSGRGGEAANISLMPLHWCTSLGAPQGHVPDVHRGLVVVAVPQHIAAQATTTSTHGAAKSHQEPPRARPKLIPPSLVGGQGCTPDPRWGTVPAGWESRGLRGVCTNFWQQELSPRLWACAITRSPAIGACPGFEGVAGKWVRSQHTFKGLLFLHKTHPNTYKKKTGGKKKSPNPGIPTNERIAHREERGRRREQRGPALPGCTSPSPPSHHLPENTKIILRVPP